jgi:protein disulfide-isomerase
MRRNTPSSFKPGLRDCIRDAFRKGFGIRALFFALDAPQGAPRQSPMCGGSKPLRNPSEANRGFRVNRLFHFLPPLFFLGATAALWGAGGTAAPPQESKPPPPAAETAPGQPGTEPAFIIVEWVTDMDEARTLARSSGKDILVAFVCSDSSVWSGRLDSEVFSRPAFAACVTKHFVCVLIDEPRTYQLSEEENRKNTALRRAWKVQSYPTVFLADGTGRPYAVTGYRNISATAYANLLLELRAIRERRDRYFAAAKAAAAGNERVAMLSRALREMDDAILLQHYHAELLELRKLDPSDSTGLISDIEFTPKITRLRNHVLRLVRQKKHRDALNAVDEFVARNSPTGEHLQKVLFLKLPVYAASDMRDHEAVLRLMDAIIAINAKTEQGRQAVEVSATARALIEARKKDAAKGKTAPPPK